MKAAQINEYGDPTIVHITQVDKPVVQPGQVLVEVHAASLNPFDTTIRSGKMRQTVPLHFPVTLGGDIAGIVAQVGADVTNIAVGDKVYGQAIVVGGGSGALAEFATTSADKVAKAPGRLDFVQAASLPLVGASALQALTQHIKLQKGQKILIIGGTGGIGSIAVQVARHIGAYVATTTSGSGLTLAKQLGANQVIDFTTQDFTTILSGYDAAFDTAGGDNFDKALRILKKGGIAVSMITPANEQLSAEYGVVATTQFTKVTTAILDNLTTLVQAGAVQPQVGKVFSLDDIVAAFQARESGHVPGKVVIRIR